MIVYCSRQILYSCTPAQCRASVSCHPCHCCERRWCGCLIVQRISAEMQWPKGIDARTTMTWHASSTIQWSCRCLSGSCTICCIHTPPGLVMPTVQCQGLQSVDKHEQRRRQGRRNLYDFKQPTTLMCHSWQQHHIFR